MGKRTQQWLVTGWAQCNEPGCEAEVDARNAQAWAHAHAAKTGHRVHLNLEYGVGPKTNP